MRKATDDPRHARPRIRAQQKKSARELADIRKSEKVFFGYTALRASRAPKAPADAKMPKKTEDWCVGGGLNNNHRTFALAR